MTTTTLTPTEAAELDDMRAKLRAAGYVDVEQHGKLRVGVRVCHHGHQWPGAHLNGTGVVVALTEKANSSWSQSWQAADIEMVVLWDKPWPLDSRLSQLAQYHVLVVENAEETR